MVYMHKTPREVLQNQAPELKESTVTALPSDIPSNDELDLLRQQRIRFDGFFTGPTW